MPSSTLQLGVHTALNSQTYTVQAGNTLSGIASQFGISSDQLVAANSIQNPNLISVGEVLTIPS
uniref:LysM peptidoglycan-binding domain-containing protein n=1 Tax=Glaciimonas immobilis TaxID=728004 RepID=UPI001ADBB1BE